jgi:hypothetical protein
MNEANANIHAFKATNLEKNYLCNIQIDPILTKNALHFFYTFVKQKINSALAEAKQNDKYSIILSNLILFSKQIQGMNQRIGIRH